MRVGLFNSVYAETIVSLLGYFAKDAEVRIAERASDLDVPYDIFIINRVLPKHLSAKTLTCDAAVVDSDDGRILRRLRRASALVVTYGFNSKASLTVSGVAAEESPFGLKVAFCLRRSVKRSDGDVVLQQEFLVDTNELPFERAAIANISEPSFVARCLMPAVTAAIIAGKSNSN